MKIVIAGGTGLIGENLAAQLIAAGDSVTLLTRSPSSVETKDQRLKTIQWNGKSTGPWTEAIEGADAVVNLCGESIASKRWTKARKARLRSSRLDPTRALIQAIRSATVGPKVLINASAVGFYGWVSEYEIDEKYPQGKGFLANLCADWEAVAREVETLGVRTVLTRFGVVLSPGKGALQKMIPPFEWLVGGPFGSGEQWFSWIHIQDAVSLIVFALKNDTISGPVNACAPYPVRMSEFSHTLGRVLGRPSWLTVPASLLKILLGEMADMLINGQRVIPRKMLQAGFKFRYSFLEAALISILSTSFRRG